MKKISVIFSILTVALLAIVAMGCPVAYTVGSPYSASPATTLDADGESYSINYDALIASYTGDATIEPLSVTISGTATSGGDWNMSFISSIAGGNLPAATATVHNNFVSTVRGNYNGWWGFSTSGYLQLGGTTTLTAGTWADPTGWTIAGVTPVDVSYGGNNSYAYSLTYDVDNADTALTITMDNMELQNADADGSVVISTVRIDF